MNINRRQFIKSAVAVGIITALPSIPFSQYKEYPRGDIRRYGAIPNGLTDCSYAIQAAIDDCGEAFIPIGTWHVG